MVKVPVDVHADEVFEVILDLRLFSVICPLDADAGDKISIIAPFQFLKRRMGRLK